MILLFVAHELYKKIIKLGISKESLLKSPTVVKDLIPNYLRKLNKMRKIMG